MSSEELIVKLQATISWYENTFDQAIEYMDEGTVPTEENELLRKLQQVIEGQSDERSYAVAYLELRRVLEEIVIAPFNEAGWFRLRAKTALEELHTKYEKT
jgi:hypothetical protein